MNYHAFADDVCLINTAVEEIQKGRKKKEKQTNALRKLEAKFGLTINKVKKNKGLLEDITRGA